MPSIFPDLLAFKLFAPLVLRLVSGAIFIAHGYPKLFKDFAGTVGWFDSVGIKPAKFWVLVVGVVEFFGGIALIVGFATQLAALFIAINMIGAIVLVKRKMGLVNGYEFDLALLAMAVSLMFLGAGFYAIDLPL